MENFPRNFRSPFLKAFKAVRKLFDRGLDPDTSFNIEANTKPAIQNIHDAFLKAVEDNDSEAVKELLDRGMDPDASLNIKGKMKPAICLCAEMERTTLLEALVQAGCDINQPDKDGRTTLHYVCVTNDSWPIASYLLSKGAAVNARDGEGNTPLMAAAIYGKPSLEMLSGLLEAGSNVNCRNHNGLNVLHALIFTRSLSTNDDEAVLVEHILSCRCDVNAEDALGWTPLHLAVYYSDFRSARMLIRAGCALECEDIRKDTPMHLALRFERYDYVELLAAAGVVIPRPIWIRVRQSLKDDPERLKSLMDVGADFPKLSNLCRRAFYEYFGAEARTRVQNLPVCPPIKKYLAFEIL